MSTLSRPLLRSLLVSLFATLLSLLVLIPFAIGWLEPQAWLVNNDHLAPFDYVRQLLTGQIDWNQITHARIPSVWPDYAIAGISLFLFGQGSSAFVLAWLLQFALCVFGLYCFLPPLIGRKSAFGFSLLVACVFLFLVFLFEDYRAIVFAAGIPARHGGNWINFAFAFSLFLYSCRLPHSRVWLWACRGLLFGVSMVAVFSNRLFLIQFTVPLVSLCIAYCLLQYPLTLQGVNSLISSRFFGLALAVLAGSSCGFAQYFLSVHQCEEVPVGVVSAAVTSFFSRGGLYEPVSLYLILSAIFLIIGLYLCWKECREIRPRELDFLGSRSAVRGLGLVFVGLSISLNCLAYFSVSEDLFDPSLWRYLLVPSFLAPVGAALVLLPLLKSLNGRSKGLVFRKYLALLGLIGIAGLTVESSVLVSRVSSRFSADYSNQAQWLEALLRDHGLSGSLGFVADPPWESRRIEFNSQNSIRALSVSTDGNPRIHPHSRVQFLLRGREVDPLKPSSSDVVTPAWVLASPKDFDRMEAFWGEPLSQIGCFKDKGCLYLFDAEKVKANTSLFLSTWHSEQYGCVRGASETVRAKGLNLIRRIPVVGRLFVGG